MTVNGDKPKFNFDVPVRWNRQWAEVSTKLMQLNARIGTLREEGEEIEQRYADADPAEMEPADRERKEAIMAELIENAPKMLELGKERDRLLAQILVSVPTEWVHHTAPKKLDWSDPESLGWLRIGKDQELYQELDIARSAREEPGN